MPDSTLYDNSMFSSNKAAWKHQLNWPFGFAATGTYTVEPGLTDKVPQNQPSKGSFTGLSCFRVAGYSTIECPAWTANLSMGRPGDSTTTYQFQVHSKTTAGATLNGMYTPITVNGVQVNTTPEQQFTPVYFNAGADTSLGVSMGDWPPWEFDHWDNGSTNTSRVVTATSSPQTFTAYYR